MRLLAKLLQIPVRRVGAGPQDGKDALSDDSGLAIECKRYGEKTPLIPRPLISELEEARSKHPDLQLWILVSTKALDARAKEKLDEAAHVKGLAVLYIDPVSVSPFLSTSNTLAALCATDVETSLDFLSGSSREIRRKLGTELEAIRKYPDFETWTAWLIAEIRDRLPIWRFVVERQNLRLSKQIREVASTTFGTRYDATQSVPRKALSHLDDWLGNAVQKKGSELPPVAVVLGERYDGKTWLVYQWLLNIAQKSELPLFFVGSGRGMQSDLNLNNFLVDDLSQALHSARAYAESFVNHYRIQARAKKPWAVIVLDGLNEYAPNYLAWLRHLESALGRGELGYRPAAVIVTAREHSWPEHP